MSGFLYGSFFANEHVLEPATRFVTELVLGRPLDHIVSLQGFQKILLFFGITIGVGAVINSVGLVINIVNYARRGDWEKALLSKTGAAGALFFWYVLFLAVRVLTGGQSRRHRSRGSRRATAGAFFPRADRAPRSRAIARC